MRAVDIIRKKRDGGTLTPEEIAWFIGANLSGEVTDYQLAALLMAIYFQDLNPAEIAGLTRSFMHSGVVLDFADVGGPTVDKHSTGGVGDKVSLILQPLVACAGLRVPSVAGRGLGHTGGTIDKLEAIPGYNPFLPLADFRRIVKDVGCAIIGQTGEFCPADRKCYALRDVTGTVESIALITASIMSKKLAEGVDGLVLDVKVGSGAFMPTLEKAEALSLSMVRVGAQMGKKIRAVITDMNQPLGREIGNANEVVESLEVLQGRGESRLTEVTLQLGAHMLAIGGVETDLEQGRTRLQTYLRDGRALAKFKEMVAAQGGDTAFLDHPERLPVAPLAADFTAPADGYLAGMRTAQLGCAAMELGAGRARMEDAIDFGAGMTMHKRLGEAVRQGETICTLRASDPARLQAGLAALADVFTLAPAPPPPHPLVWKVIL